MKIKYSPEDKESAIQSIKRFFEEEIEIEIGELQATFLLEFFEEELAPIAYNQGISDAKDFLTDKLEDLDDTCFEEAFLFWNKNRK